MKRSNEARGSMIGHLRGTFLFVWLICGLSAVPALAKDIGGTASVIDGDTLEIRGQRIRLYGIDAPESGQMCLLADGQSYRCGQQVALALSDLIGRRTVHCFLKDQDRHGWPVAVCSVGQINLSSWLIRNGWALAYRYYSHAYVKDEREAQVKKAGIWQGRFDEPWDWRNGSRCITEQKKPIQVDTRGDQLSDFTCEGKRTCGQMTSCAEARLYFTQCSVRSLDNDGDGMPCETLCR